MTLHRVRLQYSESGGDAFGGWLGQWLINMQPWSEFDNQVPTLRDGYYLPDGASPYYDGQLVFDWSEDKAIIFDQLTGYLGPYTGWHRVGYHICQHDEVDPDPCAWDDIREGGTVPEWVPAL